MNTHDLGRGQLAKRRGTPAPRRGTSVRDHQKYAMDNPIKQMSATADTRDPARSFEMLTQNEEAARYRSQDLRDEAERMRLRREARLAQRMYRQGETGARRARRALAGMFLG
jgi:hypothetical protein